MKQRLRSLLVLSVALGVGCVGGGLAPVPLPTGLAPADLADAVRWTDSTRPTEYRDIRFRFKYQDEQASGSGRGRARFAPPDSLRFDISGALGIGRAAAFVVGDTAYWSDPEEEVRKLVPNYPLFWAMLGVARAPAAGSGIRRYADSTVTAWQFTLGQDTVEYVRENGPVPRLIAEVRRAGKRLGRVETKFGPTGLLQSARLTVVRPAARLDLTFYQNAKAASFAPDTWAPPVPPAR